MRTLLGFASLGAGLAVGAYVYLPATGLKLNLDKSWDRATVTTTDIGADIVVPKPVAAVRPAAAVARATPQAAAGDAGPRTFSPNSPLFTAANSPVAAVANADQLVMRPAGEPQLVATPNGLKVGEQTRSMKPADEDARRDLVRNIQKELKRIGCYGGEAHGAWTAASQRAMSAFTERINATLPVKHPDGILLTLVRGAKPGVCGDSCPSGQALDAEDRCVPKGVLAAAEKKSKVADRQPVPAQPSGKAPAPQHVAQGWTTTTTVQPAPLRQAQAPVSPPAPHAAKRPDLPGLMTVGGPKAEGDVAAPSGTVTQGEAATAAATGPALPVEAAQREVPLVTPPAPKKARREVPPAAKPSVTTMARRDPGRGQTRSVHDIFTHPLGP